MPRDLFGRFVDHLRALEDRKKYLQEQIFSSPPKTMEEFNRRLGQWEELNNEIVDLSKAIKGDEEPEDQQS